MEETNKRYRCWKCQQDLSRSVYYRHLRTNGCSSWRIPKKKSKPEIESDTVLVSQSQKQSNDIRASVDMEECIDIEKMNCSSEFCNDEPSTDSLLDSGNVTSTVVDHENESDAKETEVVLDSDQETEVSDHEHSNTFLFDSLDSSSPEGVESNGWYVPVNAICLFLNYYQLKFHVPDRGMQLLLSFLKVIIASNIEIKQLMDSFPTSLNAMRTRLNIEEQEDCVCVVCPLIKYTV